ncbi:MAG: hypothetical protein HLUCCA08_10635 [Rhodobacteraceae bacterium HLUCCA08]|nr:MAG: hypothetical protein HLUCCA08_10635 [Rhodobacteraceae bacterium HLUCCA08]
MNKDPFIPGIAELAYYDPLERSDLRAAAQRAATASTKPAGQAKTDRKG